jgi:VanZ family protein
MLINFKKKGQVALLVTVLLTIAAIFFQSALNPAKSQEESSAVGGVIEDIVDVVVKPSSPNENKPATSPDESSKPLEDGDLPDNNSKDDAKEENTFKINMPKLRKAAHFIEHGVLGTEMFFLVMIIEKNRGSSAKSALRPISLLLTLYFGMLVALVDETIQIFSERGYSIKDVWLDISGYATFTLLLFLIITLKRCYGRKKHVPNDD